MLDSLVRVSSWPGIVHIYNDESFRPCSTYRGTAEKEGDWRAYFDCVMLKIQNSIRNIFATTEDTKDQITDPDRQCPTEHTWL